MTIRGIQIYFIENFLSNERIIIKVNGTYSDPVDLQEGIPQGSVLSCTFFLIAINETANNLPPNIQKTYM